MDHQAPWSSPLIVLLSLCFTNKTINIYNEGQPRGGGEITRCHDVHFLMYILFFRVLMPSWRTAGTDAIVKDSLIMWPEGQWEALKKVTWKGDRQTDRRTDIATLWKNWPKSRFFENIHYAHNVCNLQRVMFFLYVLNYICRDTSYRTVYHPLVMVGGIETYPQGRQICPSKIR